MELLDKDQRDGYIYDPAIKGLDANFFAQLTGTTTVASSKLRYNNASNASFIQHEFVDRIVFKINVPIKPTSGDSRRWGLYAPGASANMGAIYFDITGTAFTANVIDSQGNTQTAITLTWNDVLFSAHDILFEIKWEPDLIQFWVNGSIVATFNQQAVAGIPFVALPIYIKNGNADNMDVSFIAVKRAAGIV